MTRRAILLLLLLALRPAAGHCQGNTLTLWDEHVNGTKAEEFQVPVQDPKQTLKALSADERQQLDLTLAKMRRSSFEVTDPVRREKILLMIQEVERRIALLEANPARYFATYPRKLPPPPKK